MRALLILLGEILLLLAGIIVGLWALLAVVI